MRFAIGLNNFLYRNLFQIGGKAWVGEMAMAVDQGASPFHRPRVDRSAGSSILA